MTRGSLGTTGGVHVSVIRVKLSNASGVAPSKPTVSSANAIVRLSPFLASSSGVGVVDAFGDFPMASTARIVRDDVLVFGRLAGDGCAPSASASLLRVSVAMAGLLGCCSRELGTKPGRTRLVDGIYIGR